LSSVDVFMYGHLYLTSYQYQNILVAQFNFFFLEAYVTPAEF